MLQELYNKYLGIVNKLYITNYILQHWIKLQTNTSYYDIFTRFPSGFRWHRCFYKYTHGCVLSL